MLVVGGILYLGEGHRGERLTATEAVVSEVLRRVSSGSKAGNGRGEGDVSRDLVL